MQALMGYGMARSLSSKPGYISFSLLMTVQNQSSGKFLKTESTLQDKAELYGRQ